MKSEGICRLCKKTLSGRALARHLQSCSERKRAYESAKGQKNIFLIAAKCDPFFVYFEVDASSKLSRIDKFLRDLWMECCGHMSAFNIDNQSYSSSPSPELEDKGMDSALINILKPNQKFSYEYDFGTTTHLELRFISERKGNIKGIEILARNKMPDFKCNKCGNPAKEVCSQCLWESDSLYCNSCAKEHECGEEMLLPFVNSPRSGMCGYTGNDCILLEEDKK